MDNQRDMRLENRSQITPQNQLGVSTLTYTTCDSLRISSVFGVLLLRRKDLLCI